MDNVTLQDAMAKKAALAQALAQADAEVKDLARQQYEAALEACRMAGVAVGAPKPRRQSGEASQRKAAGARKAWESKTPEQRAAWVAAIKAGQARYRATVQ